MKKFLTTLAILFTSILALASCGEKRIKIAIPNDPTNEGRALLLLEKEGVITLKDGAGITATIRDIEENPHNIKFEEVEAAQLPNVITSVDFAVINSNYAIPGGFNPKTDSLAIEGVESPYGNVVAVKRGNENKPEIKALMAALGSKAVDSFISTKYNGAVVGVVSNLSEDGLASDVDYEGLNGKTIKVACSPIPHKEILDEAAKILASKGIKLVIKEFDDYILPNEVVNDGSYDANYFQHEPYLKDFNQNKKTDLVSVGAIHVEPMGIYSKKHTSLDIIKKPVEA